jgi:uncharacterized protein (TIGR02246 family)
MRRIGITFFACIFFSLLAFSQPLAPVHNPDEDKAAIQKVLHEQEIAWNKGDMEDFMRGYKDSPETTFIGKTIQHGYQPILQRYKTAYASPDARGTLTFSELNIRMLGPDHAAVVGKFHLTRTAAGGGDASGTYSLIFEREPEGWRIILDHTTTD